MKEQIHTIPVNEAFESGDECPFCYLERKAEQSAIRYVAGSGASYMEPDVREATAQQGFCRHHMKMLYDYGNTLGCALMLQTHMSGVLEAIRSEREAFKGPEKKSLFAKKKPDQEQTLSRRMMEIVDDCYICSKMDYNMERYLATFFVLIREEAFRRKVEDSKGFCLRHFAMLMEAARKELTKDQQQWFYDTVFSLMEDNMGRVKEDLDWFISKHDYRNAAADWKNSQDAVPRTMQKLEGLHPADPVYRKD